MSMFPETIWINLTMGLIGILFFLFLVVRGIPLRMGLTRLRKRTFIVIDNDTHFSAPGIKNEGPEVIITKDNRAFGKTFRIKFLGGVKIGFAVPYEFVMTDPTLSAGVSKSNKGITDPDKYAKMEKDHKTKIKVKGEFVDISEYTKGLENRTVPVLVKAAMSRAYQEGQIAKERDPIKYGTFIMMVCLGVGILMVFLKKFGLF